MKRSAAIMGPTPQFVRWAIDFPCPFREIDPDDLSKSTFRQLRTLRTLSEGIRDNRVFEEVCVHDSVTSQNTALDNARGFLIEEVYSLFGERDFIESCCRGCPANSDDGLGKAWAGCFGWLPADLTWQMDSATQPRDHLIREKLVDQFSACIVNSKEEFARCFASLPSNWYGLWMPGILTREQLVYVRKLFSMIAETDDLDVMTNRMFWQMFDAIKRCEVHNLNLHVELIPAGYSDGARWEIFAHCELCRCGRKASSQGRCSGCQSTRRPGNPTYQKVLGFRPYLLLKHLIGENETVQFVRRYLEHHN